MLTPRMATVTLSLSSGTPSANTVNEMMASVSPSENVTCDDESTFLLLV